MALRHNDNSGEQTEEKPGNNRMCIKTAIVVDVAESEPVQLRRFTSTSSIYRKQYRPCDATPSGADQDNELEEA